MGQCQAPNRLENRINSINIMREFSCSMEGLNGPGQIQPPLGPMMFLQSGPVADNRTQKMQAQPDLQMNI